jgi:hypothetical protein
MNIRKLENGTLLVPKRVEVEGVVGDAMLEIQTDHPDYARYFKEYEREQKLEL